MFTAVGKVLCPGMKAHPLHRNRVQYAISEGITWYQQTQSPAAVVAALVGYREVLAVGDLVPTAVG